MQTAKWEICKYVLFRPADSRRHAAHAAWKWAKQQQQQLGWWMAISWLLTRSISFVFDRWHTRTVRCEQSTVGPKVHTVSHVQLALWVAAGWRQSRAVVVDGGEGGGAEELTIDMTMKIIVREIWFCFAILHTGSHPNLTLNPFDCLFVIFEFKCNLWKSFEFGRTHIFMDSLCAVCVCLNKCRMSRGNWLESIQLFDF